MVILKDEYVPTKYPGYFWNVKTEKLCSVKRGEIRPLKTWTNGWCKTCVNGKVTSVSEKEFRNLTVADTIPVVVYPEL